jgi:hypothetical protein
MRTTSKIARQGWACGFEPPAPPSVSVMPWQPPQGSNAYQHGRVTVCAGYTTNLPEVVETSKAHALAKLGALDAFCGGPPTPEMLESILILDGAYSDVRTWLLARPAKGAK